MRLDVREKAEWTRALGEVLALWGSAHVLVNNAAMTVARPVMEIDPDEFDAVMAVNVRGTFLGCQVFGAHFRDQGHGRIVNLASLAGQNGGTATGAHYAASKGAITTLTKVFARDLAAGGVTVNAIAPGPLDTPMVHRTVPPERMAALRAGIPVGGIGDPRFVAALVVQLASAEAGFATGATWDVNGGLVHAMKGSGDERERAMSTEEQAMGGTVSMAELARTVEALSAQVDRLTAEAEIRRVQARYMVLCDTPCPEAGVDDDAERIDRIVDLYTEDAVWEGVGAYYDDQFGASVGRAAIRRHFEAFWGQRRDPALVLNVHYLTTEHVVVEGDEATGHWVHMQPWLFSDGRSLLRSSRLYNRFRRVGGAWKISRTRTENVFVAPLAPGWAESVGDTSVLMRR